MRIIARVIEPQQPYRAEEAEAAIGTTVAVHGDRRHIDNKAVTQCATEPPHKECSDMDMLLKVCANTSQKRVALERIAGHRDESEASRAVEREHIRRDNQVDILAKMAKRLPMRDYDPREPGDIAMCRGPAPTPARKWILQRRRMAVFPDTHWTSWRTAHAVGAMIVGTHDMEWHRPSLGPHLPQVPLPGCLFFFRCYFAPCCQAPEGLALIIDTDIVDIRQRLQRPQQPSVPV